MNDQPARQIDPAPAGVETSQASPPPVPGVVGWSCPDDARAPDGTRTGHPPRVETAWDARRRRMDITADLNLVARLADGNTLTIPLRVDQPVTPDGERDRESTRFHVDTAALDLRDRKNNEVECGPLADGLADAQSKGAFAHVGANGFVSALKRLFPGADAGAAAELRRALRMVDEIADAERRELFRLRDSRKVRNRKARRLDVTAGFFQTLGESVRNERRIKGVAMLRRMEGSARNQILAEWNKVCATALREVAALDRELAGDRRLRKELAGGTKQYRREMAARGRGRELGKYFWGVREGTTRRSVVQAHKDMGKLMRKVPFDAGAVADLQRRFVADFSHVCEIIGRSSLGARRQSEWDRVRERAERDPSPARGTSRGKDRGGIGRMAPSR